MANIDLPQGSAKGWVLYDNVGTATVLGSFNVASVTDNGTGDYTVNWDQDFANANYAACGMACDEGVDDMFVDEQGNGSNHLVGSLRCQTRNGATVGDRSRNSVIAFGDM